MRIEGLEVEYRIVNDQLPAAAWTNAVLEEMTLHYHVHLKGTPAVGQIYEVRSRTRYRTVLLVKMPLD